jgi:hypothetical protein
MRARQFGSDWRFNFAVGEKVDQPAFVLETGDEVVLVN